MSTRREFLKQMMFLSGSAGLSWAMPESIKRAVAIDPRPGSSFMDAEHVVVLMQENRSFDHCFGTLRGVRGYNDPRVITLPDKNPVWLQSDKSGKTYVPFRFDINDTKITWMGSIPHTRFSQVDADNQGKYDQWIDAKRSHHQKYAQMPLTLGYYTRDDLPFHYAMADAFTICDQNFSSAMSCTSPNRLFLWSGTIRGQKSGDVKAFLRNFPPYGPVNWRHGHSFPYRLGNWKTFPEWLEENDISWRVYQNDIATGGGFTEKERFWLSNYICNTLEYFPQFNVRFSSRYIQSLQNQVKTLSGKIRKLEGKIKSISSSNKKYKKIFRDINKKKQVLSEAQAELDRWNREQFDKLSQHQQNLYERAFTTNAGDPYYHELATLRYHASGEKRELSIPKGDILYQFRNDVQSGQLPMVSWMVAPHAFCDHPNAPWYGAWYTSEILDILTKNPDVWKKTIFILTYDENDGYFDHIPPYVAPDPADPDTGKCSHGLNVSGMEYIRREQKIREGIPKKKARTGPVGLGFRVPMIIASPWSRGGRVCSQVFDHTSTLQFLEHLLNEKYNKQIQVTNISEWRRTVTGDLTSAFRPYKKGEKQKLQFLERDPYLEEIHDARFKKEPSDFKELSDEEIAQIRRDPSSSPLMPRQETGVRPSCGLPYQLYAEGALTDDRKAVQLTMEARDEVFDFRSAGSPFKVYAPGDYLTREGEKKGKRMFEPVRSWDYAVSAGDQLTDTYPLYAFGNGGYHLRVYGPNGFFRELAGNRQDPLVRVACLYERQRHYGHKLSGNLVLELENNDSRPHTITIKDNAYQNGSVTKKVPASGQQRVILHLNQSGGWYDMSVRVRGNSSFIRQYAGRVETGAECISDPAMGGWDV